MKRLALFPVLMLTTLLIQTGCRNTTTAPEDLDPPKIAFVKPLSEDAFGTGTMAVDMTIADNVAVKQVDLYIDNGATPVATLTAAPWTVDISLAAFSDTLHLLTAKAVDAAGNRGVASVAFWKGERRNDEFRRMPLVEILTSANCTNCPGANEQFKEKLIELGIKDRVSVIKYHTWWPRKTDSLYKLTQALVRPRTYWLFAPMTDDQFTSPIAWVDGSMMANKGGDWAVKSNSDIFQRAEARIDITQRALLNGDIELTIKVKGLSASKYNDLRLHTVVTESLINYNDGNSEWEHNDVMKLMIPDSEGSPVTITDGSETTFTRTFTIGTGWVRANLKAVVFLQANSAKTVLQSASVAIN